MFSETVRNYLAIILSLAVAIAIFVLISVYPKKESFPVIETKVVEVPVESDVDLSEINAKLASVQIQLDNVLTRQTEIGDAIFKLGQFWTKQIENASPVDIQNLQLQCYAGKVQLVSPFTAPYMSGKAEPEQFRIVWEGWLDFCFSGVVLWGQSYGPTGEYGGQVRPDIAPSTGQTEP